VKRLRTGTNIIRSLLISGIVSSLLGFILSAFPGAINAELLAIIYLLNICILVAVLQILISRKLPTRINQIATSISRAAEGELSERVTFEGGPEISHLAENFNSMMEQLSGAITKVNVSLSELRDISSTIGQLSEKGVSSAAVQSVCLKRTATAIREINRSIEDISGPVCTLSALSSSNTTSMAEMSNSLESTTMHMESLVRAVEDVSSSIIEMASAVRQIKENAAILANDTSRTAKLVSEMDVAIRQIGYKSTDTSQIAETVKADAEDGFRAVDATIVGINEIKKSSSVVFDAIENLSRRVANIGRILSVIDGVAEQTNLLALNASIIAAQAGERGKSFSVVAIEIKDLAKRTGNHTREISEIILGVREETERAVKAITLSEKRISEGSELSHRSGIALRKIVEGIQTASSHMVEISNTSLSQAEASVVMQQAMGRVAEMVEQIAHATNEQSHGSDLITSSVESMRNHTSEVMHAINNHQNSAAQVLGANEEINNMVARISGEAIIQAGSSRQIGESLIEFEESTEVHVASTMVIDEVLVKLAKQITSLQNEMGRFKVNV
jgi:methyl-accepting chemotaxis protein